MLDIRHMQDRLITGVRDGLTFHLDYRRAVWAWALRETNDHVGWNLPTLLVTVASYPVGIVVRYLTGRTMFESPFQEIWPTFLALLALGILVFIVNLIRAPAHIHDAIEQERDGLRRDLDSINEKQAAVNALSDLQSEGIHDIWNRPVTNDGELQALDAYWKDWTRRVEERLKSDFTHADFIHFHRLGVIPIVGRDGMYNKQHAKMLREYALKEHRLREIIRDHNVTRVYIKYTPTLVTGRR